MDCAAIIEDLREQPNLQLLLSRIQDIIDDIDPDETCPICHNNLVEFTETVALIYDLLMRQMVDQLFSAIGVIALDDQAYQTLREAIVEDPNMFRFKVRDHTDEGVSLGVVVTDDLGPAMVSVN